ncbi:MAG: DNRLRE domain-containing protein [Phycisphaerales bacterium]|nr:MAG: DNRLRE domain-containing protein [Phycisphaerales bacterium]
MKIKEARIHTGLSPLVRFDSLRRLPCVYLLAGIISAVPTLADTVTFQEGVAGYSGTVDTYLSEDESSTSHGTLEAFGWDTDDPSGSSQWVYALIRFDDIFVSEGGLIPDGATITSATLSYTVFNVGHSANVHEVLVDWVESVTYDGFGGDVGVQLDEYGSSAVATATATTQTTYSISVTTSVQAWSGDPGDNRGWIFVPSGIDGVDVRSSEYASQRPLLTVEFESDPEAPNQPTLVYPLDAATDVEAAPTLEVTVTDPQADPMDVTFFGRGSDLGSGEDFTIIQLPDLQNMTTSYPHIWEAMTDWIVANKDALNVRYVASVGDLVNTASVEQQWINADIGFSKLEDPLTTSLADGIPYGTSVSNHDQSPNGSPDGDSTLMYNQYFGISRFLGRAYYGGHYPVENNDNSYTFFSASGMDFIVVNLEYDTSPDTDVLDWADGLLKTYSNRRAIVVAHYLMEIGLDASFGTQGQATYNALRDNPNLFLMLCGHRHGEGLRTDVFEGRTVHTILSDYQDVASGGNGWLRILQFSPANDTITVTTYSPWLDDTGTDTVMAANSTVAPFALSYDMAAVAAFAEIGTDTGVTSGGNATVAWPGRAAAAAYEWYVDVSDGVSTTTGPIWTFTSDGSCTTNPECNDGLFCNGVETCGGGNICIPGTDPCPGQLCVEALGICVDCTDDLDCADGDPCNGDETCNTGTGLCELGTPVNCSGLDDQCNVGVCNAITGVCEAQSANEGGGCSDSLTCTISDVCSDGVCVGTDDCPPGRACNPATGTCTVPPAVLTFQNGLDSYTGTVDTYLREQSPGTNHGSLDFIEWDADEGGSGKETIGLIRFDSIFGSSYGQIPVGSTVVSATLTLEVRDSGQSGDLREVLVDWDESATYGGFGGEPGAQSDEYAATTIALVPATTGAQEVDVTSSLQAWVADPASNRGWIVLHTGPAGAEAWSSEASSATDHPKLEVVINAACEFDTDCDDGNPCTDDTCNGSSTCDYAYNTDGCDDGDACTATDACASGTCVGSDPVSCPPGEICNPATGICEEIIEAEPLPVYVGDMWRYFKGTEEPPVDWNTLTFSDSGWLEGPSGIGYQNCDPATDLSDMQNGYVSVYTRRLFHIDDPDQVNFLTLTMDYDDSFVAYINGFEIARNNVDGTPPAYNTLANTDHECSTGDAGHNPNPPEVYDVSHAISHLVDNGNVLAIQGHNLTSGSSDFILIAELESDAAPIVTWTAYNDLSWYTGQLDANITMITSPANEAGLPSSGELIDYAAGTGTGVTLTVTGGDHLAFVQGAEATTGDAFDIFNGIVSTLGVISYVNQPSPAGDVVLTFTGLAPSATYEVVLHGERDNYLWDRAALVTISDADAFTNESSAATDNPTGTGGTLFDGPTDYSTRLPSQNPNGYVARFTDIDPGSDGDLTLTVSPDGLDNRGKYISALMLRASSTAGCVVDADCDDSNACTDDSCNTGTSECEYANNTDSCNDGDLCTENDTCAAGSCSGSPVDCGAQVCNPADGSCVDCVSDLDCAGGEVCNLATHTCEAITQLTFQEGIGGYTGTQDTFIMQSEPDLPHGTLSDTCPGAADPGPCDNFEWDSEDPAPNQNIGLIRFDGIVGPGAGQIPQGATVLSATLTLTLYDTSADPPADVHMLLVDWDEATVTWNNFGGDAGVQPDEHGPDIGDAPVTVGTHDVDVATAVQGWVTDPAGNFGLIIIPNSFNGAVVRSSEYATDPTERPKLTVDFEGTPCTGDGDCIDGDLCNGSETCNLVTGFCEAGTPVDCGAQYCDPSDGSCVDCLVDANCDDSDVCTNDACDGANTCQYTTNTADCDDGDACTENDVCAAGVCAGTAVDCNDGVLCTTDSCDTGLGCQNVDNCTPPEVCHLSSGTCELPPPVSPLPIELGDSWKYLKGLSEPTPGDLKAWTAIGFDDSSWSEGPSGIGYDYYVETGGTNGNGDYEPYIGTQMSDMRNCAPIAPPLCNDPGYVSVYMRKAFYVANPAAVSSLTFEMYADDGYVAYLNGTEVARIRVTGTPPLYNTTVAGGPSGTPPVEETIDLTGDIGLLQTGVNVLAVQGHNAALSSRDLLMIPQLSSIENPEICTVPGDCDDADLCTTNDCVGGFCEYEPVDCGIQYCNPADGNCVDCLTNTHCSDNNVCTGTETCNLGAHTCQSGTSLDCDDNLTCTGDSCDPVAGCQNNDNCGAGYHCDMLPPGSCVEDTGPNIGDVIIAGFTAHEPPEWIELFNTTGQAISLENMNVIARTDTGTGNGTLDVDWDLVVNEAPDLTGATIAPYSFYLISETGVTPGPPDLETNMDLATGEGGASERAIGLELVIDGVHMDHVLYGRYDGSDTGAYPPGDISFDGSSYPRYEVIRAVDAADVSFTEGVTQRLSAEDLHAGYAVEGFYTDEDTLPGTFPTGLWTSVHATSGTAYVARNSASAPVPPSSPECTNDEECDHLDGVCTEGRCDVGTCVADPANEGGSCDDGEFCNGTDVCIGGVCQTGADPCLATEQCDETNVVCRQPLITCSLASPSADPNTSVALDVELDDVLGVRGYQTKIEVTHTSGTGSVTFDCPDDIQIDEDRPDYIFFNGPDQTLSNIDCNAERVFSLLYSGSVDVITDPRYLADWTLDVSGDATVGSTFEISVVAAETQLTDVDNYPITTFLVGPPCLLTITSQLEPRVTIELVTVDTPSAGDETTVLPTAQTEYEPGQTFFAEVWAQTVEATGLTSVTTDIFFDNAVVSAVDIEHTTLFMFWPNGAIDNTAGEINVLSGTVLPTSPDPCTPPAGFEPSWGRVAIIEMYADALGSSPIVSADSGQGPSGLYGTAICNEFFNLDPSEIDFRQTVVNVVECFTNSECDDSNPCTDDACVANVCENVANDSNPCDDGQACNVGESCSGGVCGGGSAPDCSQAGDDCNAASCDPNGAEGNCDTLTTINDGGGCDEGDVCIVGSTCGSGVCSGGAAPDCSQAGDDCNAASCDPSGADGNCDALTPINEGGDCDDGDACSTGETCLGGSCTDGLAVDCDSFDTTCADYECDSAGTEGNCDVMTAINEGGDCDDSEACNIDETCQGGACTGGLPVNCDSFDTACADYECNSVGAEGNCDAMTAINEGGDCNDGDSCNTGETCQGGSCTGGSPVNCNSSDTTCADYECDPSGVEGNCDAMTAINEGGDCNDGDACNTGETCQNGNCAGGSQVDCDAYDTTCADYECDPAGTEGNCGAITAINDGGDCDEGDVCIVGSTCSSGVCGDGSAPNCSGLGDQCNDASCDPAGSEGNCDTLTPANEDGVCDDGLFCTDGETCQSGVCTGGSDPCAGPCEYCEEGYDECSWCIFDLNRTGWIDGFDFSFFAGCFGGSYLPADPCYAANFDESPNGAVGGSDFGAFSACFALECADCATCWGPTSGKQRTGILSVPPAATVSLVAVNEPVDSDLADAVPASMTRFPVGRDFYIEVWASRTQDMYSPANGLASVFTDVLYDSSLLTVKEIIPAELFSVLSYGVVDRAAGVVQAVGGCAPLGEGRLGVDFAWVRVAILKVRAERSGLATVVPASAGELYGISLFGEFGNLDLSEIEFNELRLKLYRSKPIRNRARGETNSVED